jgi:UDP-galactopyranose mutase
VKALIIGSGWAGASCNYMLKKHNIESHLFELKKVVGGHSRSEKIDNVIYEPNGPHIFHTSNKEVNDFVTKFGMKRKYSHQVKTRIYPPSLKGSSILLSWPPQISELEELREWDIIKNQLDNLPKKINKKNFQDYAVSIMGSMLYELFIEGYTIKQWGMDPSELSSDFAPKRIDLRTDGNKNLFKDKWEYFHPEGSGAIIEKILSKEQINFESKITINNIHEYSKNYDLVVMTSALDLFLDLDKVLEWRGIKSEPEFFDTQNLEDKITEAYQINHPSMNESYTRTVETKHASDQSIKGSVVCKEYPVDNLRHYPILSKDNVNTQTNKNYKKQIVENLDLPVYFCGRLANYQYINQDEAILQGFNTAKEILKDSKS